MEIHHLDCCTLHVRLTGNPLVRSQAQRMVTHCLLLAGARELTLVDCGTGTQDRLRPRRRLGAGFVTFSRPSTDPAGTAVEQVRALGYDPADVRHVVLTHMDLDHVGGISDFPHATVHVSALERSVAGTTLLPGHQRGRYRPAQWRDHEHWRTYSLDGSDSWLCIRGAERVEIDDEVLLVPLPGHSRGHSGVAVRTADGWLLHAGDAYMFGRQLSDPQWRLPTGLRGFDIAIKADRAGYRSSIEHLRRLAGEPDVRLICSHDPHGFPAPGHAAVDGRAAADDAIAARPGRATTQPSSA